MTNDRPTLSDAHLRDLADNHAIVAEVAAHAAYSTPDGAMFRWFDGVTLVEQLRRDPDKRVEGRPKYVWPADVPLILNRWREPVDGKAVLLIEGTCQHLAVASFTVDVGVFGVAGCWGWSGRDLTWAKGREVVVAFDADLSTNRSVWEAAKALAAALDVEGATAVRFVKPPGRVKDGLDDVLARRPPQDRSAYMARLIEKATDKLGRAPARKVAPTVDAVAAEIMRAQPVALTAENKVALYRSGVYRRDPAAFNAAAVTVLGDAYWPAMVDAAEKYAAGVLYADGARITDRADQLLLNVANGMLNLVTEELTEHHPAYLSAIQLPVAWEPAATCPRYEAWLTAQVGAQADDLEEVAATMLDPSRTPSKAGFLFGPSRSGKSTFIRLAEAVAGSENTSAVTLAQLAENRFAAVNVYGKILNAAAEVRAGHIEDLDIFKKMTGNDPIEGERKYVQPFKFYNRTLFLFAANELPTVGESSRAYSERIKPFKFGRTFAGREDQSIEDAMMAELPGVLARWVRAWQRWRARGTYLPTDAGVRQEFEARSDRVRLWLHMTCRVVERDAAGEPVRPGAALPAEHVTTGRDLARMFNAWATGTGSTAIGERKVIDRLFSIEGVYAVRVEKKGVREGARGLNVVMLPRDAWRDDLMPDFDPANPNSPGAVGAMGAVSEHPLLLSVKGGDLKKTVESDKGEGAQKLPPLPPLPPQDLSCIALPARVDRIGTITSCTLDEARDGLTAVVRSSGALTVDVETSGYPVGHCDFQLRTVQLGGPEAAWVFDVRTGDPAVFGLIRDFLAVVPRLHAHSATADLVPLAAAGLAHEGAWERMHDTVIPAKLADPTSTGSDPGLKQLATAVLNGSAVAPKADAARSALFRAGKWRTNVDATTPVERSGWAQVDSGHPVMVRYAAADVLDTAALALRLPVLPAEVLVRERAVQRITARVAHRGLRIDGEQVERLRIEHGAALQVAHARVTAFGIDNPGSDRQVTAALTARDLVLPRTKPSVRHPNGQPSVAAGVLQAFRGTPVLRGGAGDLVAAVLDYRRHETVLSTFLEPYHQLVTRGDGRARPTVYTLGTDTGRMSCVRPNLQQLPRQGGVRACITADPGHLLVSADFSGVELRVAAALSGDANLARMITENEDLHWRIAREVWGQEATKVDRYTAKRIVFGRLYGGGVPTLARQAGVPEAIAASAVEVLDAVTPGLSAWSRGLRDAVKRGATQFPTAAGRVIWLTHDYPHKAPNYAIQGTARELLVDALLRWDAGAYGGGVVLPVHDEIVAVVPAEQAEQATAVLVECMTSELYGIPIMAEPSAPAYAWQDAV